MNGYAGVHHRMGAVNRAFLFLAALLIVYSLFPDENENYLLMQPIEKGIYSGDFSGWKNISKEKISVNLEPPFDLNGYLYIEKFIEDFSRKFYQFGKKSRADNVQNDKVKQIEWSSMQLEEMYAVQSLNLVLKDKRTEKNVYYKFIFFLAKVDKEWKIYYLRGLKI
jgi:hypothetical protein